MARSISSYKMPKVTDLVAYEPPRRDSDSLSESLPSDSELSDSFGSQSDSSDSFGSDSDSIDSFQSDQESRAKAQVARPRAAHAGCVGVKSVDEAREIGFVRKRKRTKLLESLKNGTLKLKELLDLASDSDPKSDNALVAGPIRVKQLLLRMPRVGKLKVNAILTLAQVDAKTTLRHLTQTSMRPKLRALMQAMLDLVPFLRTPGVIGMSTHAFE